jgi:hypothetical protein
MKGEKPLAFGTVAFGEDDKAAAFFYPVYTLINCSDRSFRVAAINKKAAEHENPDIKERNVREFFFCHKSDWPVAIGKQQNYVKIAAMVAYKANSSFIVGDILPARDSYVTLGKLDYCQSPALGNPVNGLNHRLFEAQYIQNQSYNPKRDKENHRENNIRKGHYS